MTSSSAQNAHTMKIIEHRENQTNTRRQFVADLAFVTTLFTTLFTPLVLWHLMPEHYPASAQWGPLPWVLEHLLVGPLRVLRVEFGLPADFMLLCAAPTGMIALSALALRIAHDFSPRARHVVWGVLATRHLLLAVLAGGPCAYMTSPSAWVMSGLPLVYMALLWILMQRDPKLAARRFEIAMVVIAFEHVFLPALV